MSVAAEQVSLHGLSTELLTAFPKHHAMLGWCIHQVGVHEEPAHSNRGPIQRTHPSGGVSFFETFDFLAGSGYPWCVDTIQAGWAAIGHPLPYHTAGAYDLLHWARGVKWAVPSYKCVPGDPIILNIGSGHAATLEKIVGNQFHTIDGNWRDRVQRVVHSHHEIAGGIHVPEIHVVPPPKKIPWSITVTSATGHKLRVVTTRCTKNALLKYVLPPLISKYGKASITIRRGKK